MSIWRIAGVRLVLHIFGMVAGIKLMPMTLMLNKGVMSSRVIGAASFQISEILLCWHREDDEFSEGQRQSAKAK